MPFQVSPGVAVVEKDLSLVIPQIAASIGATAGFFRWGPVETPITIANEGELANTFGKPVGVSDFIARSFYTASNFLSYSNNMVVVRAVPTLEVINIIQFLKLIFLPCPSVKNPSSNICKNTLKISG